MSIFVMVRTNVAKSRELQYNQWYDEVHCPQLLSSPGAIGARRFRYLEKDETIDRSFGYLALYEYSDLEAVAQWVANPEREESITDYVQKFGPLDSSREILTPIWP